MRKKLGELLVEVGLITAQQLEQAITEHRKAKMKLGQYLIWQGILDEIRMVEVLSRQLRLDRYYSDRHPLDPGVSQLVGVDFVQKYQAAPLRKDGNLLLIAMTDPLDIEVLDRVENMTGCEVKAVICTEQELNNLLKNLYGDTSGIGGVLDDIQFRKDADEIEEKEGEDLLDVSSLQGMAEGAPVVRLVNEILSQAVREGASDVHISPEKESLHIRFRIDGKLRDVPSPQKNYHLPIISRVKILANMDIATMRLPQDGRFSVKMNHKEINIRASTIPTIYGENLVLRLLDTSSGIFSLEQLGMSEEERDKTEEMLGKPYGMFLSTGPTGSGKTTSLYAILKRINQPDINIITLEDPVEYRVDTIRQTQLNRKAGMTFASGIRSILRQDPDVIMVGEIRDSETATIAVQAALTGHRVLSTLHTNNAAGAITRFLDMGIAPFLVSSVLLLSIAQRLVRKVCPYCRERYDPPDSLLNYWGGLSRNGSTYYQAKGCINCLNTGYKGRTGIFEVLVIDEMVQEMILRGKSAHDITRATQQAGKLRTLRENAAQKICKGLTTFEEAGSVIMT